MKSASGRAGLVDRDGERLEEHRVADLDDRRAVLDGLSTVVLELRKPSKSLRPAAIACGAQLRRS